MDSDKRDEDSTVQYAESRPTKKGGFLGHLKRFWWIYLIALICIVVLVVPLVIFVGVRRMAQHKLDKATLEIQGIIVNETTADGFVMSINSTIASDSTKATIEAFNASMYLEDEESHTSFATILFPETRNQPMQSVNVSQYVPIENLDALTRFNTWLLANDSLRITVKGDTHIRVKGINHRYPATFKKTITMDGLSGFAGMSVQDTTVTSSTFDDGTSFHTTVNIPNKSLVNFDIGNTTFHTYLDGSSVGTAYIDNVFLAQGDNSFALRALINAVAVVLTVDSEPYCGNGTLPFVLNGENVNNNGNNLTYFSDALAAVNSTVQVPLTDALANINITVSCPSS